MAFKQRISAIIVIRLIAKILSNLKVIRLILAIKLYIISDKLGSIKSASISIHKI
jgi:hypothetical protein